MKGHNYGLCRKCGKIHTHPVGMLGKHTTSPMQGKKHSEETKRKYSETRKGKGNSFYGHHHTEETKDKIRKAHLGLPAPESLKRRNSELNRGDKNNFWLGGMSLDEKTLKNVEYREFKPLVIARDGNICKVCGKNTPPLGIHHIDLHRENNDLNNLILVCRSCHGKLHWRNEPFV